jgi:hypothetical protein
MMRSIDGPYLVSITSTERGGGLVKQMLEEKKELVSQLFVKQLKGLSCKSDVFVMFFVRPFVRYTTSIPSVTFRFLHLMTSSAYIF